jgi:hypothetical protein
MTPSPASVVAQITTPTFVRTTVNRGLMRITTCEMRGS